MTREARIDEILHEIEDAPVGVMIVTGLDVAIKVEEHRFKFVAHGLAYLGSTGVDCDRFAEYLWGWEGEWAIL